MIQILSYKYLPTPDFYRYNMIRPNKHAVCLFIRGARMCTRFCNYVVENYKTAVREVDDMIERVTRQLARLV